MMKAISLDEPKQFRYVDIPEPPALGPHQVRVKIHRIGICGTDYGGYLGKMPFYSYPRIPGHELGVEVLEVGEEVMRVRVGDRCAVEPYLNCGKCYSCIRGHTNCCEFNQTLGVMCDGGMTREMVLPANKLHVSKSLAWDQLALVETLAIGCHAVNRGAPQKEESILIIGAGPIGLSAVEFAKLSGAKTMVMDMVAGRLEFVESKMGGVKTILLDASQPDEALKKLGELTDGRLADVVVDATGSDVSMSGAVNYCAFSGRLVYVGITQRSVVIPHPPALHRRELTILASRNALPDEFRSIIDWIEEGKIDTKPWITHRAGFSSMIECFPQWLEPSSCVIKAIVNMDE